LNRTLCITAQHNDRSDVPDDGLLIVPGGRARDMLFGLATEWLQADGLQVAGGVASWQARVEAAEATEATRGDPAAWAQATANAVDALLRAGVTERDLPSGVSRRVRTAAQLADRYQAELFGRELVARPAALHAATERGGRPDRTWHVRGYVDLTPETARFVARHALIGSSVRLLRPSDACVAAFEREGWETVNDRGAAPATPTPHADTAVHAYRFASPDDEVRWVIADIARRLKQGTPASKLLLIDAQAAARRSRYRQIAHEFGVPLRLAVQPALADTQTGQLVLRLLEVVERPHGYEPVLRLLQHQQLPKMEPEAYNKARLARPRQLAEWMRFDARAAALDWPGRDTPAGYTERLAATLNQLGLPDAVHPSLPGVKSSDDAPASVWQEVLAAVGLDGERQTLRSYVQTARVALQLQPTETPQTFGPEADNHVTVALWDDVGHRQDTQVTYVIGANEARLPPSLNDDATLDFHDRAALHDAGLPIETALQRAERQRVHLQEVLHTTHSTLIFGVPAQDEREALLPSPILKSLGLEVQPAPTRAARSLIEARQGFLGDPSMLTGLDPLAEPLARRLAVERGRESERPHDRYDGSEVGPRDPSQATFSATSLSDFGGCPFKFYARHLLGVRDHEEESGLLPPRVRGRLWHHTLELAGKAATAHLIATGFADEAGRVIGVESEPGERAAAFRQATLDALEAAFAEAETREFLPEPALWSRMREVELTSLRRLIQSETFVERNAVPFRYEAKLRVTFEGLKFIGYVDRIDRMGDALDLIDYKLGVSKPPGVPDETGRVYFDVQLPLYRALIQEGEGERVRRVRYLSMRSGENLDSDTQPEDEPLQIDGDLLGLIDRVKQQFADGHFPVQPDAKRQACERCDLHAVCRIGPRVERKPDALYPEAQA
jgi:hypothetical protein